LRVLISRRKEAIVPIKGRCHCGKTTVIVGVVMRRPSRQAA
jgi:hypothetical protein